MFRHALISPDTPDTSIHFLSFKNRLHSAVRSARSRIWISAYVINANLNRRGDPVSLLFELLRYRMTHGIDVRIICDDPAPNRPNYHCNKMFLRWFTFWDIPYCTPPEKFTAHMKCILIDNAYLFIGSHNLAKSSLENPLECTVELRSPGVIAEFAAAYEMIWNDAGMKSHMPPFQHSPDEPRPWMEHVDGESHKSNHHRQR